MNQDIAVKGIIINGREILLVKQPDGFILPTGHPKENESVEAAMARVIQESAGLEVESIQHLDSIAVTAHDEEEGIIQQDVELFFVEASGENGTPPQEKTEWVHIEEAVTAMRHTEVVRYLLNYEEELFEPAW